MNLPARSWPFTLLLAAALLVAGLAPAADFVVRTVNDEFAYTINGVGGNPPLTLNAGQAYTFDISTCACHPFQIVGVPAGSVTPQNNINSGMFTFVVPAGANTYSYQCSIHLFGNSITVPGGGGPAQPATATTTAASAVSSTSATLNASVNPTGSATNAYFLYGTDPALNGATSTTFQAVGSGSSAVAVTAALTGLQPVTKYYYQVQATGVANVNGTIQSFTTLSNDASLSGLTVSHGSFSPGFDPGSAAYSQVVAYPVSSLTFTPTVNESHATVAITVNGTAVASGPVPLSVGSNTISVLVTAQDGVTTQSYTVSVNRAPLNNTDYGFGDNGVAQAPGFNQGIIRALVVQPDGKTVAVGSGIVATYLWKLVRYNPDGSLDTAFNQTGTQTVDLGGGFQEAEAVALQKDGKIVIAGYNQPAGSGGRQMAVVRLNVDGSLDTSFNTTGKLLLSLGTASEQAAGVAVQADNKIVVAGQVTASSVSAMAVVRLNADGSLDSTFNGTGHVISTGLGGASSAVGVAIRPDGMIIVGGATNTSPMTATGPRFAWWRYQTDGTVDATFGSNGLAIATFPGGGATAGGMAVGRDGRLVMAGLGSNQSLAVARFNADGSLDSSFNSGGRVTTLVNGPVLNTGTGVALQADGKVLVTATALNSGNNDVALVRLNVDGSLDTTFNGTGGVTTDLGGTSDRAQAVAVQKDGRIVVGGRSGLGGFDFALLRFNSGLTFAPLAWGTSGNGGQQAATPQAFPLTGALAGKTVTSVAAGNSFSVALCADGTVAAWGSNTLGQLGSNAVSPSFLPVAVDTSAASALHGRRVVAVAAGDSHALALCSDGTVAAWGNGIDGELGNGANSFSGLPVAVSTGAGSALQGKLVAAIAAGGRDSYFLTTDGKVAACGSNTTGGLGLGSTATDSSNLPLAADTSASSALSGKVVKSLAAGLVHVVALCTDGSVVTWGQDCFGAPSSGTAINAGPTLVDASTGALQGRTVISVAAGIAHSLALCSDGTVAAWGSNNSGQIDPLLFPGINYPTPEAVNLFTPLSGHTPVAVRAGGDSSFAVCADGRIAAWGDNGSGQLGNGGSNMVVDTTAVAAMGGMFTDLRISPGGFTTFAIAAVPAAPQVSLTRNTGQGPKPFASGDTAAFADTETGFTSATQTFTLTNAGTAALQAIAISVAGTGNPGDVVVNAASVPASLDPGASASFTIAFRPTAGGLRTATVQVTSNDAITPVFNIQVQGTIAASDSKLSLLSLDNGSFTSNFTPQVLAYQALIASGVTSLTVTPVAVQAGAVITIRGATVASGSPSAPVHFEGGSQEIDVVVTSADGTTTHTYTISFTADDAAIRVENPGGTAFVSGTSVVDFGTALPGSGVSQDFVIRNTGTQPLNISGASLSGANAGDFSITTQPAASVAAAGSTTCTVRFSPAQSGPKTASLRISSDDGLVPQFDIGLSGHTHAVAFASAGQTVVEGAVTLSIPVHLTSALGTAFTVPVTFSESPALADYTPGASTLKFTASGTAVNATVTLKNNSVASGDRTLTLRLGTPSDPRVALGAQAAYDIVIKEDDVLPQITQQPASAIVALGAGVTFTSGASGSPPLALQWKHNNAAIAGATTASYTIPAATLASAGSYVLTATNHHPAASSSTVQLAVVDTSPHVLRFNTGTTATMTASAAGNGITYQWQHGGGNLSSGGRYAGVTSKTLSIKALVGGDAGDYVCVVTSAATGPLSSGAFTLQVPTQKPTPMTPAFPDSVINNAYSYQVPYDSNPADENQVPTKFACTGLPAGLVCNATTGLVTGKPTKTGSYTITVTLSNGQGPAIGTQSTMTVFAFPTACVGAYVGTMDRDLGLNANLGGRVDVTTSSAGSFTGSLKLGGTSYPLSGTMVTAPPVTGSPAPHPGITFTFKRTGTTSVVLALDLDPGNNGLGGSLQAQGGGVSLPVTGWRNIWHTTAPASPVVQELGVHAFRLALDNASVGNAAIPQGFGYGTLTVASAGGTTVAGRTADGQAISCPGILSPTGQVVVYQMLYTNKGSLLGEIAVASDGTHALTGTLDWRKTTFGVARDYAAFGSVPLSVNGGPYAKATPVLALTVPTTGVDAELDFAQGGVSASAVNPNVQMRVSASNAVSFLTGVPNLGKATLSIAATTGAFSGHFTLKDGSVSRTVNYQGQLVPSLGMGFGYFLLPQLANPSAIPPTTASNSPILSGSVTFGPP